MPQTFRERKDICKIIIQWRTREVDHSEDPNNHEEEEEEENYVTTITKRKNIYIFDDYHQVPGLSRHFGDVAKKKEEQKMENNTKKDQQFTATDKTEHYRHLL